jgi:hypothetical protein
VCRSSKAKKLVELHDELHILNKDIHHVETKQQKTLPAPESSFLALPSLPTLTSHTWLQIHMQPKGGGVFPSVTVEDVSAQHCTPSACGSQKRGQDSRGTLEGPQQSDASLQPPPSPGTGAGEQRPSICAGHKRQMPDPSSRSLGLAYQFAMDRRRTKWRI